MDGPQVDIRPPAWFARLAVVGAVLAGLLGIAAAGVSASVGDPLAALLSLLAGVGLGAMALDASQRWVRTDGDELVVRQWFRELRVHRDDIEEFTSARGSLVRWDIVAIRTDEPQLRLWVTRMLAAGRETRMGWLVELEAWRTWIGAPGRR